VEHYPTHIDRQLTLAPLSEFAMMQLQILSGGDRFANCVQWFSLVGSAVGVSLIARALRGSLNSQIVAAVIAVSVPMGLLQSTSTQNDYAVTFWLVCLTYWIIKADDNPGAKNALLVGLSLALAIFTKGTAYLIAFPFMLVYSWRMGVRNLRSAAVNLLVVSVLVLLVNGGHYARNLKTYGNPISPGTGNGVVCTKLGAASAISCVTKNIATQLSTGVRGANAALGELTEYLHGAIGIKTNDPNLNLDDIFVIVPARIQEDIAANPAHMILMLLTALALAAGRKWHSRQLLLFAGATMLSFVVLSVGIKWNPYISRYFLPVLVISAPFISLTYDRTKLHPVVNSLAVPLLLYSFFILANNEMRPLVGRNSVLVTNRIDQYFMARPQAKPYFTATANMIKGQPLTNVGILNSDGNMWEYVLWILLQENGATYRIEHVEVENASGAIKLQEFSRYFPVRI
jgi:4-amino-4-deoxy-L-arabinose transferase-like glycosyltransferase